MPERLRVVLEGGALCGLYQVGVLKVLQEREARGDFVVEAISGASIGSYLAFCYYNDSLDMVIPTLERARRCLRQRASGKGAFARYVKRQICDCSDETFERIRCGRIHSSRTNITSTVTHVDSEYASKEQLADAILCSMHVPYITGPKLYFQSEDGGRYVDGVFPKMFRDRQGLDYNVLYVCNTAFTSPRRTVTGWCSSSERINEGAEDARVFLDTGIRGSFCSYVHDWTITDFISLRCKQSFVWAVRTMMFLLTSLVQGILAPVKLVVTTLIDDILLHLAFGDFGSGSVMSDALTALTGAVAIVMAATIDVLQELSLSTRTSVAKSDKSRLVDHPTTFPTPCRRPASCDAR